MNAAWLDDGAERRERAEKEPVIDPGRFLAPIRFKEKKTASFH